MVVIPSVGAVRFRRSAERSSRMLSRSPANHARGDAQAGGHHARDLEVQRRQGIDDADLEEAVNAAVFGGYMNQGQVCMSTERIIVDERVADAFVTRADRSPDDYLPARVSMMRVPTAIMASRGTGWMVVSICTS